MADVSKSVAIIFEGKDNASGVADKLAGSLEAVGTSAGLSQKQIDKAAEANAKWDASAIKSQIQAEKLKREQADLGNETGKTADKTITAADAYSKFSSVLKVVGGSLVVKEFLDANSAIEKLRLGFTSLTGDSQSAAKELDYVREASDRLGIKLEDAGSAYLKLASATKGTALEGDNTRLIFESLTKQLTLLGGSSADVAGALVQVSQGISKGKFELEDLKSIAERIPGFFDKFAQSLNKTTPELFALVSAGKIGAKEFLIFAESLNKSIGSIEVDTYEAQVSRLSNATKGLFVAVGDTGAFGAIATGVKATAVGVTDLTTLLSKDVPDAVTKLRNGDFRGWFEDIKKGLAESEAGSSKWLGVSKEVNTNVEKSAELSKKAGEAGVNWAKQIDQAAAETKRLGLNQTDQTEALIAAYKKLGLLPASISDSFIEAFELIVKDADASGEQITKALTIVFPKIDSAGELERVVLGLQKAAEDGKITWDAYGVQVNKASDAFLKNTGYAKDNTDTIKKQADETKKAAENSEKLKLELEKLASNERIKALEFRAEINVAQIQADAQKVIAAFDAISNSFTSTGDVISTGLGALKDLVPRTDNFRLVEEQLDKENKLRREAFELQKELTQAQIENIKSQTRAFEGGGALIKIDGAGLQPQLEAFMWEILRTIQTRVNRDGLSMLLGV